MNESIKEYLGWAKFFILTALFEICMFPSRLLDWAFADKGFRFRLRIWGYCYNIAFFLGKTFVSPRWLIACERELDWWFPKETTKMEERHVFDIATFWSKEDVEIVKRKVGAEGHEETIDFGFFQWLSFYGNESQPIPVSPGGGQSYAACVNGDYEYHLVSRGKRDNPIPVDRLMLEYSSRKIRDEFRMF